MTKTKLKNDVLKGVLMAAAVAAALPVPHLAFAQAAATDLNANVQNLEQTELANIPDLIAACFYIGGTVFCGMGLYKLKQHAENAAQTPVAQGVVRLSIGACLIALPSLATALINTFGMTNGPNKYTRFTNVM